MKALIVGHGNVGKALAEVLTTSRCEHRFFNGRTVNADFIRQVKWADVVFNAMSTKGRGDESLRYLLCCAELGRIVITAEKAGACLSLGYTQALFEQINRFNYNGRRSKQHAFTFLQEELGGNRKPLRYCERNHEFLVLVCPNRKR